MSWKFSAVRGNGRDEYPKSLPQHKSKERRIKNIIHIYNSLRVFISI